jgi:alpha-L-fucosidase
VTPQWFKEAKFGIYTHWGVYAVPAYRNEWYPRNMYDPERPEFAFHSEEFGDPAEYGYKDFIPRFTAEKFDAGEWADLFKEAGAQFAGPVAEHHDGFAMWDSALTTWDAADMGPRRDVVGELEEAIRERGMRFVTSFHHAFNWKYYELSYTPDRRHDTEDPLYAGVGGIYPEPHETGAPESEAFLKNWEAKVREVIDKYRPDYLWFDFGWKEPAFEEYKKSVLAYYYNRGHEWGTGVVVTHKDDHLPPGVAVLDLERGKLDELSREVWITDTSVDRRSWCYIREPEYKTVNTLVDNLVDRVSKNGNLLLNIGPRPDGTIPEEQKELLRGIGDWLRVNGEAIYGTEPWLIFGEGPTEEQGGSFSESRQIPEYTAEDIRFTAKGDVLYVTALDRPETDVKVAALKSLEPSDITGIEMLGSPGELEWELREEGLFIAIPAEFPRTEHAFVFKLSLFGDGP